MSALAAMMPPVKYAEVNGIRMAYYEAGPEGEGAPLVFCHGFPEIAFSWRHQIKALSQTRPRIKLTPVIPALVPGTPVRVFRSCVLRHALRGAQQDDHPWRPASDRPLIWWRQEKASSGQPWQNTRGVPSPCGPAS